MILGVDASNLTTGGGLTYLRAVLGRPAFDAFDQMLVFGRAQLASELPEVWTDRVVLQAQPELSIGTFRAFSGSAIPSYGLRVLRSSRWRDAALPRLLERHRVDVLLAPGGLIPRRTAVRTVVMSHNMLPFEPEEAKAFGVSMQRARLWVLRRQQLGSFANAEGIIFLSRHARHTISQYLPTVAAKSVVIPNGVDEAFRRYPKPPNVRRTLLYVSTIDVYKHQWNVVEALAALGRPDVRLRLVGPVSGPSLRRTRDAVRRTGMEQQVSIEGPVDWRLLPALYHEADAFVFASTCESCPISLLDALAASLPVACSDRAPMPEFAGDAARYFDPLRVGSITEALEEVLRDDDLPRRAHERSKYYTWDRCATETVAFLSGTARTPT